MSGVSDVDFFDMASLDGISRNVSSDGARAHEGALRGLSTGYVRPLGTSILLHSAGMTAAWGIGIASDKTDVVDMFWAPNMVLNSWAQAIGTRMSDGLSFTQAWQSLPYRERLLLLMFTTWGARLSQHVITRGVRSPEDPRYATLRSHVQSSGKNWWSWSLPRVFLSQALFQTVITLPTTLSLSAPSASLPASASASASASPAIPYLDSAGVFLFSAGLFLETVADAQISRFHASSPAASSAVYSRGVFALVRYPNYLGDALCHAGVFLLSASTALLSGNPLAAGLAALGPAANYAFLRRVGGDRQAEASQKERYARKVREARDPKEKTEAELKLESWRSYRSQKNAFWPKADAWREGWLWAVLGAGVAGAATELVVRRALEE